MGRIKQLREGLTRSMRLDISTWAVIALMVSQVALLVFIILKILTPVPPLAPLFVFTVDTPQLVQTKDVKVGGIVTVKAHKCNLTGHPLSTSSTSQFVELSPERRSVPYTTTLGALSIYAPGCITPIYNNQLPVEVTPGVWRLEGEQTVYEGERTQKVPWFTESFRVVP